VRNPFARPRTTGEWLLGSACWVVSSYGSWSGGCWLLAQAAPRAGPPNQLADWFFAPGFLTASLLVVRFAVLRAWMLTGWEEAPTPRWLKIVAYAWFGLLVLGLVLGTLVVLFFTLFVTSWQ